MIVVLTTRYIGLICYTFVSGILIASGQIVGHESIVMLLSPLAIFIGADQLKHRNEVLKNRK
jgi:hypothetical protein|tara:strand:+ start:575 stop:760 length:186 start_codon:yes stop_codon:yes gene_type:complete